MSSSISIDVDHEQRKAVKLEKTPMLAAPRAERRGYKKGIAVTDFVLRLGALAAVLGAAATMGMADQTLPFFTQFFQFEASYDDLPTFSYFVIGLGIVAAYLFLSLPISFVSILRPHAAGPRLALLILDTVALTLATSCGSAATAIVYLAHNGNSSANWLAVCMQFTDFCQTASGAVVSSFVAVLLFVILVALSAISLRRTY